MEFIDYENYLINKEKATIHSNILTKKQKEFGSDKKAYKEYKTSDEFKEEVLAKLNRNKNYLHIISEEGRKSNKEYYNKHKLAIDNLIKANQSITEFAIKKEEYVELARTIDLSYIDEGFDDYYNKVKTKLIKFFKTNKLYFAKASNDFYDDIIYNYGERYINYDYFEIDSTNFIEFVELYERQAYEHTTFKSSSYKYSYFAKRFRELSNKIIPSECQNNQKLFYPFVETINKRLEELDYANRIVSKLQEDFTISVILDLLKNNENYSDIILNNLREQYDSYCNLKEDILNSIPDKYADLYPKARQMHRHFVLHIGPTNSGKTYEAIQKLEKSETGVYLAPLRLLAYEQYDKMNKDGIACNLLTGEEFIDIPSAKHTASTIEMANLEMHYDCAVIDEAQMISDSNRGASWTKAILGLLADEIHICAAKYAENILIRLIKECGDSYEIIHTKRQTSLVAERKSTFKFPQDIQDNDALIVFSRKDVHAVASALQSNGIKCSMIYGNLPYDVRHKEAEKFNRGQTSVLVATDAIGMGLNLPIKRIVFMTDSKFDGTYYRELLSTEVQQIAGRAGRYGIFDKGSYIAAESFNMIKSLMCEKVESIDLARISFATSLINLNLNLSLILRKWNELPEKEGYRKSDISKEIELCKQLEQLTSDKYLIYKLITIPFSDNDESLKNIWLMLAKRVIKDKPSDFTKNMINYSKNSTLETLEHAYKMADLYYYFYNTFWYSEEAVNYFMNIKSEISKLTINILDKQSAEAKRCKRCGAIMPWNHRYGICSKCYNRGRSYHYNYDYDYDDSY